MIEIQKAKINTAGAYVCVNGLYPFAIGTQLHNGHIPVFRLGGHRVEHETGWQCTMREVYEETSMQLRPITPATTFLLPDGDDVNTGLEKILWQHETDQEPAPMLVVAYRREGNIMLSLMYLAQADRLPIPSSEVKGLLLLDKKDIHRLCREPITLGQYLKNGGKALLNYEYDRGLVLEPFIQLQLLSRMILE